MGLVEYIFSSAVQIPISVPAEGILIGIRISHLAFVHLFSGSSQAVGSICPNCLKPFTLCANFEIRNRYKFSKFDQKKLMEGHIINIDPEILGGTPVFSGTRVPIKNLFDYLESGESIDYFLDDFESVQREQVIKLLEMSQRLIETSSNILHENLA